ncbi:hypothetical protein M378DRAFT_621375 [Amanita muscaria Koide BX008]|uniref:Uncharacterized protein n=1 Tax=Amanita muscaria (strain Koide BX008) TaxID=946122 RepID=A0A0C2XLJ3_AMAMK|nr:hypothetical protein M378DRAFT_621375 [Amanita muscaria Koide BX008]
MSTPQTPAVPAAQGQANRQQEESPSRKIFSVLQVRTVILFVHANARLTRRPANPASLGRHTTNHQVLPATCFTGSTGSSAKCKSATQRWHTSSQSVVFAADRSFPRMVFGSET